MHSKHQNKIFAFLQRKCADDERRLFRCYHYRHCWLARAPFGFFSAIRLIPFAMFIKNRVVSEGELFFAGRCGTSHHLVFFTSTEHWCQEPVHSSMECLRCSQSNGGMLQSLGAENAIFVCRIGDFCAQNYLHAAFVSHWIMHELRIHRLNCFRETNWRLRTAETSKNAIITAWFKQMPHSFVLSKD